MGIGDGWDVPADESCKSNFTWFRVKPGRVLVLVVLSDGPLWYRGHYIKGRMEPCYGEDCARCHEGLAAQIRFIVAAAELTTRQAGLWEMGASTAEGLRGLSDAHGRLPGLVVEVSKYSKSERSKTLIRQVDQVSPLWIRDIEPPEPRRALELTWQKAGFDLPEKPSGRQSTEKKKPATGKISDIREELKRRAEAGKA